MKDTCAVSSCTCVRILLSAVREDRFSIAVSYVRARETYRPRDVSTGVADVLCAVHVIRAINRLVATTHTGVLQACSQMSRTQAYFFFFHLFAAGHSPQKSRLSHT